MSRLRNFSAENAVQETIEECIIAIRDCPTVSAAEAKLQAILQEKKNEVRRREKGEVDFPLFSFEDDLPI